MGGVAFAIWLSKKAQLWPAYLILCGVFVMSVCRMFRSFEMLVLSGFSCLILSTVVGHPQIAPFGLYVVGIFAGFFAVSMVMGELARLFEKSKPSDTDKKRLPSASAD